jgi:hypothetical protein
MIGNKQNRRSGLLATIPLFLIPMMGWYVWAANRIIPTTEQEASSIAMGAYIYGYSLVTTKITGLAFTNTVKPNTATFQEPVNQLVNQPSTHQLPTTA